MTKRIIDEIVSPGSVCVCVCTVEIVNIFVNSWPQTTRGRCIHGPYFRTGCIRENWHPNGFSVFHRYFKRILNWNIICKLKKYSNRSWLKRNCRIIIGMFNIKIETDKLKKKKLKFLELNFELTFFIKYVQHYIKHSYTNNTVGKMLF